MILTNERMDELFKVNKEINSFPYKNDISQYNCPDFWIDIRDKKAGDCEDYTISKLHKLLELGWPINDLKIALCFVETGEYHAVLSVETDKGTYILDNRYKQPMLWKDLPYKWDKRQIEGCYWEMIE